MMSRANIRTRRATAGLATGLLACTTIFASAFGSAQTAVPAGAPPRDTTAPRTGDAIIRGRVVSAETGAPLARAEILLVLVGARRSESDPVVATDEQGRYEFRGLTAGRY